MSTLAKAWPWVNYTTVDYDNPFYYKVYDTLGSFEYFFIYFKGTNLWQVVCYDQRMQSVLWTKDGSTKA